MWRLTHQYTIAEHDDVCSRVSVLMARPGLSAHFLKKNYVFRTWPRRKLCFRNWFPECGDLKRFELLDAWHWQGPRWLCKATTNNVTRCGERSLFLNSKLQMHGKCVGFQYVFLQLFGSFLHGCTARKPATIHQRLKRLGNQVLATGQHLSLNPGNPVNQKQLEISPFPSPNHL